MSRFFATMLGQILAIIAGSFALALLLFHLVLSTQHPKAPPPLWPWSSAYRISTIIESFRLAPERVRSALVAAADRPDLSIRLLQDPPVCDGLSADARDMGEALATEFSDRSLDLRVHSCETAASGPGETIQVLARLGDQTLEFEAGRPGLALLKRLPLPILDALLFLCVAAATMSAWASWRVIGPLRRLSQKADALGGDAPMAPIREEGPLEIRQAARAFNRMQDHAVRSIQDRSRVLAAICHDLRTPLTRMRLLIETRGANEIQGSLLKNISLMQSMVTSTLAFFSDAHSAEDEEWLDLGALLSTLCDEFEDAGAAIRYVGPRHILFRCRPNAMMRAFTNLVENGCHFGNAVTIRTSVRSHGIVIDVTDDGPGIPEQRLRDVIEPFVHVDPSRSHRPGSVGLGLSIVNEIVQAHRGTLTLMNGETKGLVARVDLPASLQDLPRRE